MSGQIEATPAQILPNALLDVAGAASFLNVSPRTVEFWVAKKHIPFVKIGEERRRLTRFRPESLRAWIDAQETKAETKTEKIQSEG